MFKKNKKYLIRFLIIAIIIPLIATSNFAQSPKDSLLRVLDKHITENGRDKKAAEIYTELYEIGSVGNPLASLQYITNAINIYTQLNDMSGFAKMQRYLGDNYFERKYYVLSMNPYMKALQIFDSLNNESEKAYTLLKIGKTYLVQRIDSKAIESFENAYSIFKEMNNKRGLSFAYENIAIIKIKEYDYNEAFALLDSSLQIRIKLNNNMLIAGSYEKIGKLNYTQLDEYQKASEYYEKALLLYKNLNEKIKEADVYYNLGKVYLLSKEHKLAEKSFKSAEIIYRKNKLNDKLALTQNKLGLIALKYSDFNSAKILAQKALDISIIYDYSEIRKESYKLLSNIYSAAKSYEVALEYMNLYTALSDSIFKKGQNMELIEFQINIATEKEKQKNEILEKNQQLQEIKIQKQESDEKVLYVGLSFLAVVLILAVVSGLYFYKINKETKKANKLLIEKNDEINQQKEEISAQNDRLEKANVAITIQKNEIELKSKRITASMNYASRIQRAMSPKMKEVRENLPDSFVILSPKEAVSGDFFWYAVTNDEQGIEKILIMAIDCTGHGVPGAFMSMIGDAFLTQIVYQQNITSPEVILHKLHDGIATTLNQGKTQNTDGMDMAICVIDKKNKTMEFAGAKNPLVYIQNEELTIIKGNNLAIGGILKGRKKRNYTKHIIDISVPTRFYLYSDGFQDQFGGEFNKKYMARRFRNFLLEIHKQDILKQAVSLAVELEDWKDNREQMDDILVVGVKLDLG